MSIISFDWDTDNSMNRLFDDFVKDLNAAKRGGRVRRGAGSGQWIPLIDVHENDKEFLIDMELPVSFFFSFCFI